MTGSIRPISQPWTPKEDNLYRKMVEANMGPDTIAAKPNRPIQTLRIRAYRIGLPVKRVQAEGRRGSEARSAPPRSGAARKSAGGSADRFQLPCLNRSDDRRVKYA
jgi:hypothetical protein